MNLPDIITPIYETKKLKIKNYPCHVNRASQAGHPCEKYLVFSRTRWQDKLLHDVTLQFIYEAGNVIEERAFNYLREAGFTIVEQQRPYEWKEYQLTGHIDAKIKDKDFPPLFPLEIKGINHWDFEKINAIEDLLQSKKVWLKGYPAQVCLYMLMSNSEYGCLFLIDKTTFKPKAIWIELDYSFAEDIIQKLERVNKHIKDNTLPDGTKDVTVCKNCGFLHICLPDMIGTEVQLLDEPTLEEKIKRWQELKPLVAEYNKLDKEWKKQLEGQEKTIIGDYFITGQWIERKGHTVADGKYWKTDVIIKPKDTIIGGDDTGD